MSKRRILDSSAVLALIFGEKGSAKVDQALNGGCISVVNYGESLQVAVEKGLNLEDVASSLSALGLEILPYAVEDAVEATRLHLLTRGKGVSLADRACLATASTHGLSVLTADRAWKNLDLGIEVELIR